VHLVLAGMRSDGAGTYRRVDITKPRLAAMKQALGRETERLRAEREPLPEMNEHPHPGARGDPEPPTIATPAARPVLVRALPLLRPARIRVAAGGTQTTGYQRTQHASSLLAL